MMGLIADRSGPAVDFREHMKEKAAMWGAFQVHIGENFAVFEFDKADERDIVLKSLSHYEGVYNYKSYSGPREQLAVVEGKPKK